MIRTREKKLKNLGKNLQCWKKANFMKRRAITTLLELKEKQGVLDETT